MSQTQYPQSNSVTTLELPSNDTNYTQLVTASQQNNTLQSMPPQALSTYNPSQQMAYNYNHSKSYYSQPTQGSIDSWRPNQQFNNQVKTEAYEPKPSQTNKIDLSASSIVSNECILLNSSSSSSSTCSPNYSSRIHK